MTAALYARLVERGEAEWGAPVDRRCSHDLETDRRLARRDGRRPLRRRGRPARRTSAARRWRPAYDDTRPLAGPALRGRPRGRARARPSPARALPLLRTSATSSSAPPSSGSPARPTSRRSRRTCSSRSASRPPASGRRRRSGGHRARTPAPPDDPRADNPPVMGPAGRLHLTLQDWARFQQVFLTEGGDFLAPASVERLLTPSKAQSPGWAPARGLAARLDGPAGLQHVLGRHRADRPRARADRDGGVQRREAAAARGVREARRAPPAGS